MSLVAHVCASISHHSSLVLVSVTNKDTYTWEQTSQCRNPLIVVI